jgi:hypothetical protein
MTNLGLVMPSLGLNWDMRSKDDMHGAATSKLSILSPNFGVAANRLSPYFLTACTLDR